MKKTMSCLVSMNRARSSRENDNGDDDNDNDNKIDIESQTRYRTHKLIKGNIQWARNKFLVTMKLLQVFKRPILKGRPLGNQIRNHHGSTRDLVRGKKKKD